MNSNRVHEQRSCSSIILMKLRQAYVYTSNLAYTRESLVIHRQQSSTVSNVLLFSSEIVRVLAGVSRRWMNKIHHRHSLTWIHSAHVVTRAQFRACLPSVSTDYRWNKFACTAGGPINFLKQGPPENLPISRPVCNLLSRRLPSLGKLSYYICPVQGVCVWTMTNCVVLRHDDLPWQ